MSEIGDDPIWKFALLMERGMLLSRNNWSVESAAWRRALARYRLACVPGKDDDLKTHLGNSVRYETIDSCLGVLSPPPEYLRPRSISSPWNRNFYRRHCLCHPTFFSNMEFHPKPFRLLVIITNPSLSPLLEAIAVERNGSESTIVHLIATWLERELNWLISPRTARKIVARFRPIFFQSNHFRDKCQSYRVKGQHPSPCVDLTTSSSLCALLGRAVEFGTRERYSTRYPRGIEEFTWEIHCYVDPLTHGLRIEATLRKFQQSSKTVLQIFERIGKSKLDFSISLFFVGKNFSHLRRHRIQGIKIFLSLVIYGLRKIIVSIYIYIYIVIYRYI